MREEELEFCWLLRLRGGSFCSLELGRRNQKGEDSWSMATRRTAACQPPTAAGVTAQMD